ncbi:hypothetical protein RO3G_03827 [Rhizopus delemar RA 99-880]|uniref:SAM domain-containing protein n=1 Tax=Rhizopus delemar (strain RA 99-880 / ATCC MYA-4621 / FGSC 9543 / NRRL 43880) TaxID=246409 RepID=I1BSE2_RHIO9|nr:hypothetical protein RO3G_03827 [Rhizopus delemar RA 99-880]|eukprot:EIE79122.1 hypothetical protein RO3G_03827 [Rhizopus delemar RA 99-880]
MSTTSSTTFQRNHVNELFSTLLSSETAPPGNKKLNYPSSLNLSSEPGHRQTRPFSEVLKPESFASPESQALDKWYEDLQQYERNLESMASASVDPKFKEEVQHVDQWFRYLNEAERTSTIYTLLQHSSQVQIRFFMTVLQQMSNRDPLGTLLSPAHPEKVLPYHTRPPRHSFTGGDFLAPKLFDSTRPKSVMLDSELTSIFSQDWPYTAGLRPKSADVSNWSFNPSVSDPLWPSSLSPQFGTKEMNDQWNVIGSNNSNRRSRVISNKASVPSTVSESDEKLGTSTLLSMFDNNNDDNKSELERRSTSPIPSTSISKYRKQYGQYLNVNNNEGDHHGYTSDHSDQSNNNAKKKSSNHHHHHHHSNGRGSKDSNNKRSSNDVVDMELLEDVPAWLRSLRLHKYNPIFEKMKWQDMLKLDDEALLAKGVAALGARRKLLKVFDQIKAHCEANNYSLSIN